MELWKVEGSGTTVFVIAQTQEAAILLAGIGKCTARCTAQPLCTPRVVVCIHKEYVSEERVMVDVF
jgi:hypothetical protein